MVNSNTAGLARKAGEICNEIAKALVILFWVLLIAVLLIVLVIAYVFPYAVTTALMFGWVITLRQVGETLFDAYAPGAPVHVAIIPSVVVALALSVIPFGALKFFGRQSLVSVLGILSGAFLAVIALGQSIRWLVPQVNPMVLQVAPGAMMILCSVLFAFTFKLKRMRQEEKKNE